MGHGVEFHIRGRQANCCPYSSGDNPIILIASIIVNSLTFDINFATVFRRYSLVWKHDAEQRQKQLSITHKTNEWSLKLRDIIGEIK
jgi:hypothetical protein